MALQASGPISASQIRNEFAGVTQVSFSQYFRHAEPTDGLEDFSETYTSANNSGVPTTGAIKFSDFYSKYREVMFKVGSGIATENANTSTLFSTYWGTNVPKRLKNNGTIGATSTANAALVVSSNIFNNTLVIDNAGSIQGAGGAAGIATGTINGGTGGTAIRLNSFCSINNTGNIYGGGGGGGAGTAGGAGGAGGAGTTPGASVTTFAENYGCNHAWSIVNCDYKNPDTLKSWTNGDKINAYNNYVNAGCQQNYPPQCGGGHYIPSSGSGYFTTTAGAPIATAAGTAGTGGDGGNGGVGQGYGQTATNAPALDATGGPVTAPALNTPGGPTSGGGGTATAGGVGGNGGIGGNGVGFGSTGGNGTQGGTGTNGSVGGLPVGTGGAAGYYLYLSRNVSWIAQGTVAGSIEN